MTVEIAPLESAPYVPAITGLAADTHTEAPGTPQLDPRALHGLAGRIVNTIAPHTEAHPAALLGTLLASFGSAAGASHHARADGADHPGRLFVAVVGASSKARKGTTWQRIRPFMHAADPDWVDQIVNGLSSGEGLIQAAIDRGSDKRLMVVEPEFARILSNAAREGNMLSAVLRESWDGSKLSVKTSANPLQVAGAHVSIVAHITGEELQAKLSTVDVHNGFGNRFLYVHASRARLLPYGSDVPVDEEAALGALLRDRLARARADDRTIHRNSDARQRWGEIYTALAADTPGGLLEALTARAEAQVLRLSVVYALLDGSDYITYAHQEAALAFWEYCRASAEFIFGKRLADGDAERVLQAIRRGGGAMTKTNLSRAIGRGLPGSRLSRVGLPRFDGQVDYAASRRGCCWMCCSYSTGVR